MIKTKSHLKDLYRTKPRSRRGYLCLDMNEGMPGLPDGFVRRTISSIKGDFLALYPEYHALKKTIAAHNGIAAENICLSNGSDGAIKYIFDAYISPGDKVLMTDPTFAMYPVYCKMFRARPVIVEYNDDLSFPMEKFLKSISRGIRMAVVVNPNNPSGTALKVRELIPIIKKAHESDTIIIVDEAYFYFYPETTIRLIKKYDNLIVLRTFSKLCGLAGLRIGYAASSPEITKNLRKIRPTYDVNAAAALFAEGLLKNKNIIRKLISVLKEGADYLISRLKEEGIEYKRGVANFVLIRCGDRVGEMIDRLERKGVLVNGNFRQKFLKDYLRVTISNKRYMARFWNIFIVLWRRR